MANQLQGVNRPIEFEWRTDNSSIEYFKQYWGICNWLTALKCHFIPKSAGFGLYGCLWAVFNEISRGWKVLCYFHWWFQQNASTFSVSKQGRCHWCFARIWGNGHHSDRTTADIWIIVWGTRWSKRALATASNFIIMSCLFCSFRFPKRRIQYNFVFSHAFFADVLGLEQFKLGHENGGSQDVSRIM